MRISIIVAVAENGVIGRSGQLPWKLSADLQRFKRLTMGHTIIMGRRTWESIGRPLPGRKHIVITHQANYTTPYDQVTITSSLDQALSTAKTTGESEAFIIGGGEVYREAFQKADRLYMTLVMGDVEGDTYFMPEQNWRNWDADSWIALENEWHDADEKNEFLYAFVTLQRCEPRKTD